MGIATQRTLVGWKAIAGYFSRDERTVMRWAAERGMPVQRVAGQARSSVYAWPDDLDAWLRRSDDRAPPVEVAPVPAAPLPQAPVAIEVAERSGAGRRQWTVAAGAGLALIGIVLALWLLFRPGGSSERTAAGFRNKAAQASYLQATFDWNLRTRDSLHRAVKEYGDAIARDPGVAASYVGLANTYLLLREYGEMPDAEAYARAADAARVATALAPESMEAHRALAFIAFWSAGDVAGARDQFAQALALAPNDALTHHWFATALSANGQAAAALHEISQARLLDPTSMSILVDFGWLAYLGGQPEQSRLVLGSLARVDGQDAGLHRTLATIALIEHRYPDYLAEAMAAARLRSDRDGLATLAREDEAFRRAGLHGLTALMIADAREQVRRSGSGHYRLAIASAIAGRREATLAAVGAACEHREADTTAAPGDTILKGAIGPVDLARLCPTESLLPSAPAPRRGG